MCVLVVSPLCKRGYRQLLRMLCDALHSLVFLEVYPSSIKFDMYCYLSSVQSDVVAFVGNTLMLLALRELYWFTQVLFQQRSALITGAVSAPALLAHSIPIQTCEELCE